MITSFLIWLVTVLLASFVVFQSGRIKHKGIRGLKRRPERTGLERRQSDRRRAQLTP